MDFKSAIQSKVYKILVLLLAVFLVLFLTFIAGMNVGFHKARFSYQWGENYQKNFAGPRNGTLHGILRDFGGKDFINSHGAAGRIIKIDSAQSKNADSNQTGIIIMKDRDGIEKSVIIDGATSIMRFRKTIKLSDLKNDDAITVIGFPNEQGQIIAKFIRILVTLESNAK